MSDILLFGSLLLFAILVTGAVCGWLSYQQSYHEATRYRQNIPLSWMARLRWLFTIIICLLAVLGYFAIILNASGYTMQPTKPIQYEQVQEPLYRLKTH